MAPLAEPNREIGNQSLSWHFGQYLAHWSGKPQGSPEWQLLLQIGERLADALVQHSVYLDLTELHEQENDWPAPGEVLHLLRQSGLLCESGKLNAPLMHEEGHLYLTRYYKYECTIADALIAMAERKPPPPKTEPEIIARRLRELFKDEEPNAVGEEVINWQRVAAANALNQSLIVLTGGPGTGKTTTISRLLLLLLEQASLEQRQPLRILLAAPTGKAAARLTYSMRNACKDLQERGYDQNLLDKLPQSAQTLHRMLGFRFVENSFQAGEEEPLSADIVIVDEVSMVDLRMMTQLLKSLPEKVKLILVGDSHQLASVESGQVLNDICGELAGSHFYMDGFSQRTQQTLKHYTGYDLKQLTDTPALADCLCRLHINHRFDETSALGAFARQVNDGDQQAAINTLLSEEKKQTNAVLHWHQHSDPTNQALELYQEIYQKIGQGEMTDPKEILKAFENFRVLCVTNRGSRGVERINKKIEAGLHSKNRINSPHALYNGKLIMIQKNSYDLELFNGDLGVVLKSDMESEQNDDYYAYFVKANGEMKSLHTSQLPEHSVALALTVHKSQGSEFKQIALVLPEVNASGDETNVSALLTREMIYTAVTRAEEHVFIYADEEPLRRAIGQTVQKRSGLKQRLWHS